MRKHISFPSPQRSDVASDIDVVRRAFQEFLLVPTVIIAVFILLAVGAYWFEYSQFQLYGPLREVLTTRIFVDADATRELLSTIAGSIITVTSITTTLLLLIVQQSAATMTTQVFDQFLRRRSNQIYFGYFIGLALYTLITLATVRETFNPILAATIAFILTVIALYLLILIFYATIHQMRPPVVIEAIHDHTIHARGSLLKLVRRTRPESQSQAPRQSIVHAFNHGFVTWINLDILKAVLGQIGPDGEVILSVSMGGFVSYGDAIAEIRAQDAALAEKQADKVRSAIYLERSRDVTHDPSHGIQQLEFIAWSTISPAKASIAPGIHTVFSLRNLLARWIEDEKERPPEEEPLAVVYQDGMIDDVFKAFEALAIIAASTKEFHVIVEILYTFTALYPRMPQPWQDQLDKSISIIIPTLKEHYCSQRLSGALSDLITVLAEHQKSQTAAKLQLVLNELEGR
jgi:uncharacterized membrane protein